MNTSFEDAQQAIWDLRNKNGVLVAAHRGTNGGNIVQNTINAYINSFLHGADIAEVDVIMSTDGDFFTFHNGQEPLVLGIKKDIRTMSTAEIESCQLHNSLMHTIHQKVNRLDDVLEALKGRGLLNIDRSWFYWGKTLQTLKRHNMFDQIILKSEIRPELLDELEQNGGGLMYMPIVHNFADMRLVTQRKINTIAAEIILPSEEAARGCKTFLKELREQKILSWINAITLDDDHILSGGYDDDCSIVKGMSHGWGKLLDMEFDIIQTDWPMLLKQYVRQKQSEM